MAKIVLLNFAEAEKKSSLIQDTKTAISVKHGINVDSQLTVPEKPQIEHFETVFNSNWILEFPAFRIVKHFKKNTLSINDPYLCKVRLACERADKILLCMHGLCRRRDVGLKSAGTVTDEMIRFDQLGKLMRMVLFGRSGNERPYQLALIMCYAARSENALLDHEGRMRKDDLKTSFAYKFFKSICEKRPVRMTARTGSMTFDPRTGHCLVEEEASVISDVEHKRFRDFLLSRKPLLPLRKGDQGCRPQSHKRPAHCSLQLSGAGAPLLLQNSGPQSRSSSLDLMTSSPISPKSNATNTLSWRRRLPTSYRAPFSNTQKHLSDGSP
jgi:hypothetical protein